MLLCLKNNCSELPSAARVQLPGFKCVSHCLRHLFSCLLNRLQLMLSLY